MIYIVMEIGCLECKYESNLLGVYKTMAEAKEKHPRAVERDKAVWGGDSMEVIFMARQPQD